MRVKDFWTIATYFAFPALLFVLTWILLLSGLYASFPWLDIPMHIIGGFSVAVTYFLTINFFQHKAKLILNGTAKSIFVISLVALTAVLWEFFEFSLTAITGYGFQGDLTDTMADLFNGLIGGIIGAFFLQKWFSKDRKSVV